MKPMDLKQRHIDYLNNVMEIPLTKEQIVEMFESEDSTDQILKIHEKLLWKGLEYDSEKLDFLGPKSPMDQVSANQDLLIMFRDEKFNRLDPEEDVQEKFFLQEKYTKDKW